MKWTIYRHELMLFNPKHKRLRLFFEQDPLDAVDKSEFAAYHRQVQQILASLRFLLGEFEDGAEITIAQPEPPPSRFKLVLPDSLRKGKGHNVFIQYLEYCSKVLSDEGLEDTSAPQRCIKRLLDNFRSGVFSYDTKEDSEDNRQAFSTSSLMHLGSSLPILPHWDVPGVFSTKAKSTLLRRIQELTMPVYAAELINFPLPREVTTAPPNLDPSERLFGYKVQMRACFSESAAAISSTLFVSKHDFFAYCHLPEDSEALQYQAYGILIDAIQKSLAGSWADKVDGLETESQLGQSNEAESEPTFLFYIAYPIKTSVGRTHFWHIWLRPEEPQGALEQLWASWWPLQQRFLDWPARHAWLAAELEQIDIAYAQGQILRDIHNHKDRITSGDEQLEAAHLVSRHGHILFPATCFCSGRKRWEYKDDIQGNLTLGSKWEDDGIVFSYQNQNCQDCKERPAAPMPEKILFKEDYGQSAGSSEIQTKLQHRRYRRMVDQQRFLAEQMLSAHRHQVRMFEQKRQLVAEELRQLLTSKPWFEETLEALAKTGWEEQRLLDADAPTLDGRKLTKAGEMADCLFGKDNPQQQLVVLLSGGLHLLLSSILELHPVKGYSHIIPDVMIQDFLQCCSQDKINAALDKYLKWMECAAQIGPDSIKSALIEHFSQINRLLRDWKKQSPIKYPAQLKTVIFDPQYPASKLTSLKKECSTSARDTIKRILSSSKNATTIEWSTGQEAHKGSDVFRASLPASVLFPIDLLETLKQTIGDKYWYRICWLPFSDVEPWKPTLVRNYLAMGYHFSGDKSTPPDIFEKIQLHLSIVGGRLFVVFKNNGVLNWNVIRQDKSGRIYLPATQTACWPNNSDGPASTEFSLLFQNANWNTVILWTFDGYYISEGS